MAFSSFPDKIINRIENLKMRIANGDNISYNSFMFKIILFSLKTYIKDLRAKEICKDKLNIGIQINGGIGDQCVQMQWVKEFINNLHKQQINFAVALITDKVSFIEDMVKNQIANLHIFSHKESQKYRFHLYIDIFHMVKARIDDRLALIKFAPNLINLLNKDTKQLAHLQNLDKFISHYSLIQYGVRKGLNLYDMLGLSSLCKFDHNYKTFFNIDHQRVQQTLEKFKLQNSPFILINSSVGEIKLPANISQEEIINIRNRATKLIPKELGNNITKLLKQKLPDYKLIQIGESHGVVFDGIDLNLLGQTSLSEAIDLVYAANCQINNDTGFGHIRHAMGKTSVCLWGPTDAIHYGYPNNINIQGNCPSCTWITDTWGSKCMLGDKSPRCMNSIKAEQVVRGVQQLLQNISIEN